MTLHLPPPSLADLEHPLVGALSIFAPGIADASASEAGTAPDPRARVPASAPGPQALASAPGRDAPTSAPERRAPAPVRRPDRPRAA
ncbi:hypothetical protein SAMN06272735_5599 [Streptomyces sp. TLI_55]|uniref:hypothetical protein n=1 Tax=Streptomyces sp. TLI_55 TaxID=1938861 RepID=UPI000BD18191|nr:hypothetical protein [Streptomyces sp. TLI_55]SNX63788.1 hypothetical protein SAMN06272735_5599 [Streptomyces sp. TLI_55]